MFINVHEFWEHVAHGRLVRGMRVEGRRGVELSVVLITSTSRRASTTQLGCWKLGKLEKTVLFVLVLETSWRKQAACQFWINENPNVKNGRRH